MILAPVRKAPKKNDFIFHKNGNDSIKNEIIFCGVMRSELAVGDGPALVVTDDGELVVLVATRHAILGHDADGHDLATLMELLELGVLVCFVVLGACHDRIYMPKPPKIPSHTNQIDDGDGHSLCEPGFDHFVPIFTGIPQ